MCERARAQVSEYGTCEWPGKLLDFSQFLFIKICGADGGAVDISPAYFRYNDEQRQQQKQTMGESRKKTMYTNQQVDFSKFIALRSIESIRMSSSRFVELQERKQKNARQSFFLFIHRLVQLLSMHVMFI